MKTHSLIKADIVGHHDQVKEVQRQSKKIIEAHQDELDKVKETEANITKWYKNIQTMAGQHPALPAEKKILHQSPKN